MQPAALRQLHAPVRQRRQFGRRSWVCWVLNEPSQHPEAKEQDYEATSPYFRRRLPGTFQRCRVTRQTAEGEGYNGVKEELRDSEPGECPERGIAEGNGGHDGGDDQKRLEA